MGRRSAAASGDSRDEAGKRKGGGGERQEARNQLSRQNVKMCREDKWKGVKMREGQKERRRWRRGNSHQYSSLVLSFQPRQMRANIRKESGSAENTPTSPSVTPLPLLHFSPISAPLLSQKRASLTAAVSLTAGTLPNIAQTLVQHNVMNKRLHSPFSQVNAAAWASCRPF